MAPGRFGRRAPATAFLAKAGVNARIDLSPDLVEEGFDDRFLVIGPEFAVRLGGRADLVTGE